MSYGVDLGGRRVMALLWLGCRPAATTPIRPLAWEPPHDMGVALKRQKKQKKKKRVNPKSSQH